MTEYLGGGFAIPLLWGKLHIKRWADALPGERLGMLPMLRLGPVLLVWRNRLWACPKKYKWLE